MSIAARTIASQSSARETSALHERGVTAGRADRVDDLAAVDHVAHDDARALGGEQLGRRPAHAAARRR